MPDDSFYKETYHCPFSKAERLAAELMYERDVGTSFLASYLNGNLSRARVFVSKMRRKLDGTGWQITMNKGGGHMVGTYRLERAA